MLGCLYLRPRQLGTPLCDSWPTCPSALCTWAWSLHPPLSPIYSSLEANTSLHTHTPSMLFSSRLHFYLWLQWKGSCMFLLSGCVSRIFCSLLPISSKLSTTAINHPWIAIRTIAPVSTLYVAMMIIQPKFLTHIPFTSYPLYYALSIPMSALYCYANRVWIVESSVLILSGIYLFSVWFASLAASASSFSRTGFLLGLTYAGLIAGYGIQLKRKLEQVDIWYYHVLHHNIECVAQFHMLQDIGFLEDGICTSSNVYRHVSFWRIIQTLHSHVFRWSWILAADGILFESVTRKERSWLHTLGTYGLDGSGNFVCIGFINQKDIIAGISNICCECKSKLVFCWKSYRISYINNLDVDKCAVHYSCHYLSQPNVRQSK